MNLFLLLIIPTLTAIGILLSRNENLLKWISFVGAALQMGLAVGTFGAVRYAQSLGNAGGIFFERNIPLFSTLNINLHVGVDGIAAAMVLLTSLVVVAGVLVSWNVKYLVKEFFFLLILLSLGAYGFFISLDLFVLFFFLEIAVIPKYLLIGIWGSGKKEYAANKLALMLMGGSALVMVGIIALYFYGGQTFNLVELSQQHFAASVQSVVFPLLFLGFGVFTALFPFHTWVPDGHSSAPTAGSMFLAGISMKLGGYGCLRIATFLLPEGAKQYADIIIILSVIAILYGAFATMMQKDLKYLNAYSSVSHVGFSLLGIGMLTHTAVTGSVLQMVSHGLMTALFFAVIGMIYDRTHTRIIREMGGLLKPMPFISTAFVIVGLCSLGLPGFSGFVAEITVLIGSWQHGGTFYNVVTILAAMSIVVTAVYILRAIGKIVMGPLEVPVHSEPALKSGAYADVRWNEKVAVLVLVIAIVLIGVWPGWLNEVIKPATQVIVDRLAWGVE